MFELASEMTCKLDKFIRIWARLKYHELRSYAGCMDSNLQSVPYEFVALTRHPNILLTLILLFADLL